MSDQKNKIEHGIEYEYDAERGIVLPTKFIPANDSDYKLFDAKDIDWNNSHLSYINKIQNISEYIYSRYNQDTLIDESQSKPYWKKEGKVNSSQELLDIINYLISRVIYADQKIQEFIDKENLLKVYLSFDVEGTDIEKDENGIPKTMVFNLVPNEYDNRSKVFNVVTVPLVDASVDLTVQLYLMEPSGSGIYPTSVASTKVTKNLSGDEENAINSYFNILLNAYGFNPDYNSVKLRIRFFTNTTEKFEASNIYETHIEINKSENPIEYIVINNIIYKVFKENTFFDFSGNKINSMGAIAISELKDLEIDEFGEYIFEENVNSIVSPTIHSKQWFYTENKVFFFNSNATLCINIPNGKNTSFEIYTKYDISNCKDLNDKEDNEISCGCILETNENPTVINDNLEDITIQYNNCKKLNNCSRTINNINRNGFIVNIAGKNTNPNLSKINLKLYLGGTKYIKTYSNIVIPLTVSNLSYLEIFKNQQNISNWAEKLNPNNKSANRLETSLTKSGEKYIYNVEIPLLTDQSFNAETINDPTKDPSSFLYLPIYSSSNDYLGGFIDIKIHETGENVNKLLEIDYNETWESINTAYPEFKNWLSNSEDANNPSVDNKTKCELLLNKFIEQKTIKSSDGRFLNAVYYNLKRATVLKSKIYSNVFDRDNDSTKISLPLICKIPAHTSGTGTLYEELKFTFNLTIVRGSSDLIALTFVKNDKNAKLQIPAVLNQKILLNNIYQKGKTFPASYNHDEILKAPSSYPFITSRSETFLNYNVSNQTIINNKWYTFGKYDMVVEYINSIKFIRSNYGLDKTDETKFEWIKYLVGDINDDGSVDSTDVGIFQGADKSNLSHKQKIIFDVNCDGSVDGTDYAAMLEMALGGATGERRWYTNDYDITNTIPIDDLKFDNVDQEINNESGFELLSSDIYYGANITTHSDFSLSFKIERLYDTYNILNSDFDATLLGSDIKPSGYSGKIHIDDKYFDKTTQKYTLSINSLFDVDVNSEQIIKDRIDSAKNNIYLKGLIIRTTEDIQNYVNSSTSDFATLYKDDHFNDSKITFDYENDSIIIDTNGEWEVWKDSTNLEYKNNIIVRISAWKYFNEIYYGKIFNMTLILKRNE